MNRKWTIRLWELVAIIALLGILAVIFLPALARSRESSRRASCQNNLKQLGLVIKMYASETKGERFPPLSPIPGNWMMDMNAVYPEYLMDLAILVCPSSSLGGTELFALQGNLDHMGAEIGDMHPDCVSSLFYTYTGYVIFSDEQAKALFDAYCADPAAVIAHQDLECAVPVWAGSDRVELPGAAGIPVVWDRVSTDLDFFNHIPGGCNVLHLDGHIEFVRYSYYNTSNFFPVTRLSAETFGSVLPIMPRDCYVF